MLIGSYDIQSLTHRLAFPSSLESLAVVEKMLGRIRFQYTIAESRYNTIWVVLNEAVTNAIAHGNKCDPEKQVRINVTFSENRFLRFTVKDEGEGFDPNTIPDPTSPERISKPGGRGIFLMKKLSDSVLYSDFGKTVEITFYLQKNVD